MSQAKSDDMKIKYARYNHSDYHLCFIRKDRCFEIIKEIQTMISFFRNIICFIFFQSILSNPNLFLFVNIKPDFNVVITGY